MIGKMLIEKSRRPKSLSGLRHCSQGIGFLLKKNFYSLVEKAGLHHCRVALVVFAIAF